MYGANPKTAGVKEVEVEGSGQAALDGRNNRGRMMHQIIEMHYSAHGQWSQHQHEKVADIYCDVNMHSSIYLWYAQASDCGLKRMGEPAKMMKISA